VPELLLRARRSSCGTDPYGLSDDSRTSGEKRTFDDATLLEIARQHGKSAAQVMLRWHLQEGRSAIPKSTKPARIAENFDVFDFELASEEVAAIDDAPFDEGKPKKVDIDKMHAYRDAIRDADDYRVVRFAGILYPVLQSPSGLG
jgi:hypothetical protein